MVEEQDIGELDNGSHNPNVKKQVDPLQVHDDDVTNFHVDIYQ